MKAGKFAHVDGSESARKPYNNRAGYICSRRSLINRGWVVIYLADAQGVDVGAKYAVVCETHNIMVGVTSVAKGRPLLKRPDFCEQCMASGPIPRSAGVRR